MVGGAAVEDAVSRARRLPTLRVGLHLVLVEGRPVLPPSAVPDLVDAAGRFRADMFAASLGIFAVPRIRRQVAAEIAAQFERFAETGLTLDHVDAHKHFHLHPTIARMVCRIGQRYGMTALRAPVEPAQVLREVEGSGANGADRGRAGTRGSPGPSGIAMMLTRRFAARLARRAHRRGIRTTDRVFGLAWSGAFDEGRLAGLLARLPDGVSEIYCHPATSDRFAGAAPGYRYVEELEALLSPRVAAALGRHGIRPTAYADLTLA